MAVDFLHSTLGPVGPKVHRLGFSASYRPGRQTVKAALDAGLDYFFWFGFDGQMVEVLRDLAPSDRQRLVIATGAYNYKWWQGNVRKACERRLRQLGSDYLDVFFFLGVLSPKELTERVRRDLVQLRNEGKVRAIGVSTHDRAFAGRLAQEGEMDVLMVRYNAVHRGAEHDVFPLLGSNRPAIVGYTATCWTRLIRRPRWWLHTSLVPTAGDCYRFVLSEPRVDVCLTAPRHGHELEENLRDVTLGPLSGDDDAFIREFGDAVYARHPWF